MEPNKYCYEKVVRPTEERLRQTIDKFGFQLTNDEIKEYLTQIDGTLSIYDTLNLMPDNLPKVKYPRTPGYTPSPQENKLNAWIVKCEIKGESSGKLQGRKIVLKDNICLAGVPMQNGSSILKGYMPEVDASIVTKLLEAGGTIIGKGQCEYFCMSAGSFTSVHGPVHNPYKYGYQAGGSSSGTAALVGSGEVELGIGGDQGGSIRVPASWCGCYGMKPTFGLVPYTGVTSLEASIDHIGPITQTVSDNALLLEVIAGPDDLDPRQFLPEGSYGDYLSKINEGIKGMKIGILKEGFGHPVSEQIVDKKVRNAAEGFKKLGAIVEEVSIPEHLLGNLIFTGIVYEGIYHSMMIGNGAGSGHEGLYIPSLMKAQAQWRTHPNQLSKTVKFCTVVADYMWEEYQGQFYGKAQNIRRNLRKAFDEKFKEFDLIVMPTTPYRASKIPEPNCKLDEYFGAAFAMESNTAIFDLTGHPSFSMPIGLADELPIGMMIVSKHFKEAEIYRAAQAWAKEFDWKKNN